MENAKTERLAIWLGAAMAGFLALSLFSWITVQAFLEPGRFGAAGRVALQVASLPGYVAQAWDQARMLASGEEATKFLSVPRADIDEVGFRPVTLPDGRPLSGLLVKGDVARADRGWRLLGGAMELEGEADNVAVLLDPGLTVRTIWKLDEAEVAVEDKARASRRMLHGLQVLPDGSLIHTFDHGSAMQRRDACNRVAWVAPGQYHHSLNLSGDGASVWGLRDQGFASAFAPGDPAAPPQTGLVRLDATTGKVLDEISLEQLVAANPGLGLFELARKDENAVETNSAEVIGEWATDPMHFNDIEPLPPEMAAAFPQFAVGDLLVSARDINTVMVIDPETHKVKWHHTGDMLRQHDPDWRADGTITVYDNAMGLGVSRIIAIDPKTQLVGIAYDGAGDGFYSRIRGRHMRTARGDLAVASPQQGRAFEIGADGAKVLEFLNRSPVEPDKNFVLTEYIWLPETALNPGVFACSNS